LACRARQKSITVRVHAVAAAVVAHRLIRPFLGLFPSPRILIGFVMVKRAMLTRLGWLTIAQLRAARVGAFAILPGLAALRHLPPNRRINRTANGWKGLFVHRCFSVAVAGPLCAALAGPWRGHLLCPPALPALPWP
jgi:hypothetical protein